MTGSQRQTGVLSRSPPAAWPLGPLEAFYARRLTALRHVHSMQLLMPFSGMESSASVNPFPPALGRTR